MRKHLAVLLSACLATAAAAAVVEAPVAEPAPIADPAPVADPAPAADGANATQATIEWIAEMEAATAAQDSAIPPPPIELAAPDDGTIPGTGIQRCAGADGTAIFTDKRCEDMGAVGSAAPSAGNASTRIFVRTCARTREALVNGLRDALDAQDANRVASYYHWTGMGNRAAYALMDRLHGFSQRPVVDVQLTSSASLAQTQPGDAQLGWYPMLPSQFTEPEPPRPRPPDLVRVDQMRAYDDAGAEITYFHLQANAGCWWIHF